MSKYEEQYDDDYAYDDVEGDSPARKSLKGYKIMVLLLAILLVAVSGLHFYRVHQERQDFAIERDTLTNRILAVRNDLANLETTNGALNDSIAVERLRTDSILTAFARERSATRATIRKYEAALGAMRAAAAGFAYTIDSLNQLNTRLISENLGMRREITSANIRADAAEERAADADIKIRQGSRIRATGIRIVLMRNDGDATRVNRANRLRVDFILAGNDLANPGNRPVYVRITGPDGYVLADSSGASFDFEGDRLVYSAMREVDYQNSDIDVSIYHNGTVATGTYRAQIYVDGMLAGEAETLFSR
jgi:cell division protein FtsL